jgi:predicted RNA-binding Zn ribbon-like protein
MIRVTWAWLGQGPALDLANTVAVENGVERDLLEPAGAYERWAAAEATAEGLADEDRSVLMEAQAQVLQVRAPVRAVLAAISAGAPPPSAAIAALNAASRAAPEWLEFDPNARRVRTMAGGRPQDRVVARFARSALAALDGPKRNEAIRMCGAPSCGMYYRPVRERQVWCSTQCGTRARVARSYRRRSTPTRRASSRVAG